MHGEHYYVQGALCLGNVYVYVHLPMESHKQGKLSEGCFNRIHITQGGSIIKRHLNMTCFISIWQDSSPYETCNSLRSDSVLPFSDHDLNILLCNQWFLCSCCIPFTNSKIFVLYNIIITGYLLPKYKINITTNSQVMMLHGNGIQSIEQETKEKEIKQELVKQELIIKLEPIKHETYFK